MLVSGCGSRDARPSSGIVVSFKGRIGPLRLDESDRAAIVALLGQPEAERHARYAPSAPYDALGYRCQRGYSVQSYQLAFPHPPYCRTIFWIDVATGKLETFYTSERRFIDAHGVRIGMPTATASRLVHSPSTGLWGRHLPEQARQTDDRVRWRRPTWAEAAHRGRPRRRVRPSQPASGSRCI